MATEQDPNDFTRWISRFLNSEVVIIALATVLGYALVFAYEAGFCWYYGIPYNLISLNLSTGLGVATVLLSVFYFWLFYDIPIVDVWGPATDQELRSRATNWLQSTLQIIAFLFIGLSVPAALSAFLLVYFVGRLARRIFDRWGWSRKLAVTEDQMDVGMLWRRLPPKLHFAMTVCLMMFVIAFCYGRFRASVEPSLTYSLNGNSYLVLQIYGDTIVSAPYIIRFDGQGSERSRKLFIRQGLGIVKVGGPGSPLAFSARGATQLVTLRQARVKGIGATLFPYQPF